jgi:hypothetical protein
MKTTMAYQQQNKVIIKQRHLKEARENLSLCANKPYYSQSQLSSLQLLIESLEQELKCMQALDVDHVEHQWHSAQ